MGGRAIACRPEQGHAPVQCTGRSRSTGERTCFKCVTLMLGDLSMCLLSCSKSFLTIPK